MPPLLAVALLGCGDQRPPVPEGAALVTLVHASRQDGELEPCG